jgi:capsular exopolysaccharide synthesis family protein
MLAVVYLFTATPIYTSASSVYIEQSGNKIMTDSQGMVTRSDSFLYTQAEIIKSAPILSSALDTMNWRQMKTFAGVDNPVAWLQMGRLVVDAGKKDDVITVSTDSPYPEEAATVVNTVVDAYMTAQGKRKKTTAAEMLRVLQKEKENRYAELTAKINEMLKFKEENGALSFQADKGNVILERLAKISDDQTELELQAKRLKAEFETATSILNDPGKIRAYVEDLQTRGIGGDKEYDELRSQYVKYQTMQFSLERVHGENSEVLQTVGDNLKGLDRVLAAKERAIAQEHAASIEQQLKTAESNEQAVRAAKLEQQKDALELNSKQAEYSRLENESHQIEKQCSELDNRIKEVVVNSEDSGTLDIQVVEAARAESKPSKPQKGATLSTALLFGLVLGTGLALGYDWLDQRISSPEEVSESLGIPILGVVSEMTDTKTLPERGQYVHRETQSAVAEAYRTIRTAMHFSSTGYVKTFLVTSPSPGDGKTTTASNLAIAIAQAGNRTLLVDADMRRPTMHKLFEIGGEVGISSVIQGQSTLRDAIHSTSVPRLYVLPCGPIPSNPSEILSGTRFAQVMKALAEGFDRVVIDSPPVMSVTDARILAAQTDATVLVLRMNRSTVKGSRHAIESLVGTGAQVIGTIINAMPHRTGLYGHYYGGYYYQEKAYVADRPAGNEALPADPAASALGELPQHALLLPDMPGTPKETAIAKV